MHSSTMTQRILSWSIACGLALVATAAAAQGLKAGNDKGTGMRLGSTNTSVPAAPTAAVTTTTPRSADYIVAVVNSEPVTNVEVQQQYDRLLAQADGSQMPPQEMLRREALESLINQKIQLQMAAERNISVDHFTVQQAEENIARQNGLTLPEMHEKLAQQGISDVQFRADLRKRLTIQKLREVEVDSKVRVNDLEVDQYLREQKNQSGAAATETQIDLGHILIAVPENASDAQVQQLQAKAQAAADKVRGGEDFDTAVGEFSDAPAGKGGGAMGLRPANRYPDLFAKATQSSAVGSIVGPLRSAAGFHILKVLEKTSSEMPAIVTQSHVRHILLRPGTKLSEAQAVERLEDYRRRVMDHQDTFEDLAQRYSEDGSAKNGGDLGWANPHQFVPEFEEAMNKLSPGEISEPIASRYGIHLIQLVERREAKLNQREQRDMVRSIVREKKLEKAFNTWAQEARAQAYVEYRDPPQ